MILEVWKCIIDTLSSVASKFCVKYFDIMSLRTFYSCWYQVHGLVPDGIIGYWWTRAAPASILVSTSCLVVLWTFPVPVAHVPNALPFLSSIWEWYSFNRVRFYALTATVTTCLSAGLLSFPILRSGWILCRLCSNQMSFFSPSY